MVRRSSALASQAPPRPARVVARAAGFALAAVLAAPPAPATAQVYRCQSDGGVTEYTNTPRTRCARLDPVPLSSAPVPLRGGTSPGGGAGAPAMAGTDGGPIGIVGSTRGAGRPAAAGSTGAAPTAGARVDPVTQRARDSDRRRILEDELRREIARLDDLRREVAASEGARRAGERDDPRARDRFARLKDDIGRSEGNVSALRRELASLRD